MTQEEKELLLKDLCARLPYGVIVNYSSVPKKVLAIEIIPDYIHIELESGLGFCSFKPKDGRWDNSDLDKYKPYLRPMSSMTEEEVKEYNSFFLAKPRDFITPAIGIKLIDWLNARHFDYRGLIPMGLALEAPEGMYK